MWGAWVESAIIKLIELIRICSALNLTSGGVLNPAGAGEGSIQF